MSLGRGHTADGRNPAQAGLICRLQALGWIFQFRGPVRGPGSFSMPGWGSGWRPGQCLDWGQVAQRSDQEDVDFLLWTEAAFCPAMPPGPAPGICLPRPLSGDEKGAAQEGSVWAPEPFRCTRTPRASVLLYMCPLAPSPPGVCLWRPPPSQPGRHPGLTRLCVAGERQPRNDSILKGL